tara:strand:+ start:1976 stop:2158 length:183 start_codon:yes stop_codon:yes gene_type:complete
LSVEEVVGGREQDDMQIPERTFFVAHDAPSVPPEFWQYNVITIGALLRDFDLLRTNAICT